MKILITGGSGLLGQYLNMELSKKHDILTLYNSHQGNCREYNHIKLDLLNFSELENNFISFKPDIVVHTAAISRIDLCETLPREYVWGVNVYTTQKLAYFSKKYNSKLIYTSTDLVYDGLSGSMLTESSPLRPASFYAETKLAGEVKIQETFENYIILRTALLYGFGLNHAANHFRSMYLNLKAGRPSKLFYDQYRTPLSLKNAAGIISELIEKDLKAEIINFGGKERVSRLKLGEMLCEAAGLNKSLLIKISMDEISGISKTPDVSMNTAKLNALEIHQSSIEDSIKEILSEDKIVF